MSQQKIVGVDGCKAGWIAVWKIAHQFEAKIFCDFRALADSFEPLDVIGIDVPIGLPAAGPRACDIEARRMLGHPRGSSVFPAPIRGVLIAQSHAQASQLHRSIDGRGMSIQAFGILRKVRAVDELLSVRSDMVTRVVEVHPEVSFAVWNQNTPMEYSKKKSAGRKERARLIDLLWPGALTHVTSKLGRSGYEYDDLLDAFAALWSASRYAKEVAVQLPKQIELDELKLAMRIVA